MDEILSDCIWVPIQNLVETDISRCNINIFPVDMGADLFPISEVINRQHPKIRFMDIG
jgi:hypothetical protein